MYRWTSFPFLRFVIVNALGILCARYLINAESQTNWYIYASIVLFSIAIIVRKLISPAAVGSILLIAIGLLGTGRYLQCDQSENTDTIAQQLKLAQGFAGQVASYPSSKSEYFIYELDMHSCLIDSSMYDLNTKILLYVKKSDHTQPLLHYGDWIGVQGTPFRIPGPKNPYEFDFSAYMADQNIYFQLFTENFNVQLIAKHKGNVLLSAVYHWRALFESVIHQNIKGENERAIALALLLGIKGELDTEIKSSYAAAGAMHVLAVSGLHVGILYFIILALFKPLPNGWFKQVSQPLISITILWIYALLTGFSPSIFRAVTMFTMVILGQSFGRGSNIYNSLSISAFILLLINPMNLFSLGFQLSYLAVIGIVVLYDKLYSLWIVNSYVGNLLWQWTCLSIAAQIATSPISIYYFHQFPTYFLVSNLLIIPAAFVIMILGFAMLIFSFSGMFWWIGWTLEYMIFALNWFTDFIYHLPESLMDWLYISTIQTWLIYILIVSGFCFFLFRKFRWLYISLLATFLFGLDGTCRQFVQSKSNEITFYHIRNVHLLDYIKGLDASLMTIDTMYQSKDLTYHVSPHRLHRSLPQPDKVLFQNDHKIEDFGFLFLIDRQRVLYLFKEFDPDKIHFKIETDYLVVSNNVVKQTEEIVKKFRYQTLILDHTNHTSAIDQLYDRIPTSEKETLDMREFALILDLPIKVY